MSWYQVCCGEESGFISRRPWWDELVPLEKTSASWDREQQLFLFLVWCVRAPPSNYLTPRAFLEETESAVTLMLPESKTSNFSKWINRIASTSWFYIPKVAWHRHTFDLGAGYIGDISLWITTPGISAVLPIQTLVSSLSQCGKSWTQTWKPISGLGRRRLAKQVEGLGKALSSSLATTHHFQLCSLSKTNFQSHEGNKARALAGAEQGFSCLPLCVCTMKVSSSE